jgi:hypothetical protein
MTFKDFYFLCESNVNTVAIVVDIQPLYDSSCHHIMRDFVQFVSTHKGPVVCFFNGPDIGGDEKYQVIEYFMDHGMSEEDVERIDFKEKVYAFFRNWMDAGMSRRNIIKAIRYMVMTRNSDSRDVEEDEWKKVFGDEWEEVESIVMSDDMLNIPDISIKMLKQYSGCYLMGGGEEECLSEFRFVLEAFNIKYRLIKHLIY